MECLFYENQVYVGDLCPSVKQVDLKKIFEKYGPVKGFVHKYRKNSDPIECFAFITFENPEDALTARKELNNSAINGKRVRVLPSIVDKSMLEKEENNVYMKYLDKQMTQKELYELCCDFGDVVSCKIATDERDKSKGHGFISYANEEDAKRCIEEMNGRQGVKRVLYAGPFIPQEKREAPPIPPKNNIYVRNFDPNTTDDDLKDIFKKYGEIVSAVIMKDNEGKSRQFGFVCFKDPKHAQTALAELHGKKVNERPLYLNWAQTKSERKQSQLNTFSHHTSQNDLDITNVYVKNLDESVDDSMLRSTFEKFGSILSVKVALDENGKSKGFGFVCFSNHMEARAAIMALHGSSLLNKKLYVAMAQTKAERGDMLAARQRNGSPQQQQNAVPLSIQNNPPQVIARPQPLYRIYGHPNFVFSKLSAPPNISIPYSVAP